MLDPYRVEPTEESTSTIDPHRSFHGDIVRFMSALRTADTIEEALTLAAVPSEAAYVEAHTLPSLVQHMLNDFRQVEAETYDADAAVDVFVPLWRCHDYRFAVVVEALARAVALPAIMLMDSAKACLSSMLHTSVCVEWSDYTLTQRFWAAITVDPGSAKSPSLKIILQCMKGLFAEADMNDHFQGSRS